MHYVLVLRLSHKMLKVSTVYTHLAWLIDHTTIHNMPDVPEKINSILIFFFWCPFLHPSVSCQMCTAHTWKHWFSFFRQTHNAGCDSALRENATKPSLASSKESYFGNILKRQGRHKKFLREMRRVSQS